MSDKLEEENVGWNRCQEAEHLSLSKDSLFKNASFSFVLCLVFGFYKKLQKDAKI